ncbi:MAG TPA: ATPase domain-containing protein, partial [Actinomycetes bacterium]
MGSSTSRASRRDRPAFRCTECGWQGHRWVGRCGECQAWGTVEEAGGTSPRTVRAGVVSAPAVPIATVDAAAATLRPTDVDELDRVLGGGFVPGAVALLAGEPGVGKSTLLLEVAARWATDENRALYVTAEESAAQVRLRAG